MKCIFLGLLQAVVLSLTVLAQKNIHPQITAVLDDIKNFKTQEQKKDSIAKQPLGSFTEASFFGRYEFYKRAYEKLKNVDTAALSFDDQVNLELLMHDVRNELSEYVYRAYQNPILSDAGFHTSLAGRGNSILTSQKDAEQYLQLLEDIPRYVDQHIQLMRSGLGLGISQPAIILNGYETTYLQHIVDSTRHSVFWKPFAKRPVSIPADSWNKLSSRGEYLIRQHVIPAYKQIALFFSKEYLSKTRKSLGASAMPNGRTFYEDRVRHYTTTLLTPDEVFRIGELEVDRIKAAMEEVIREVQFKGSFREFFTYLRSDPRFYPTSPEQLLKEASWIAKKAEGKLPGLFGKLPRLPYTVAPVPDYLAPTYTTGRYSGAPVSGRRAAEYWVNTYNLPSRTLYTLEALTLHEAVPGHHLQISLSQELDSLPAFRKSLYINAFGEGWGLYSEYLGHEMGFYKDPYSLFGRLTYEMWRACRLVIDVGLHAKNWTREEAVNYLADNSALSIHEVNTEINRYISWPGQALAYKMGEIKIKELRKKTEETLKEKFDLRAFHDMVLSRGSVTLSLLEKMTDRFIAEQMAKKD